MGSGAVEHSKESKIWVLQNEQSRGRSRDGACQVRDRPLAHGKTADMRQILKSIITTKKCVIFLLHQVGRKCGD